MRKAWVENGIIRDICASDPAETYHPLVAAEYGTDVPDDCVAGAELVGGVWINPIILPPAEVVPVKVTAISPLDFKMLFTIQERILINRAKQTDEVLQVAFETLDDPRLKDVHLDKQIIIETIDYMVVQNLLTAERAIDVKNGKQI